MRETITRHRRRLYYITVPIIIHVETAIAVVAKFRVTGQDQFSNYLKRTSCVCFNNPP